MRGNIVLAAGVFGLAVVLGCGVLVLGLRWSLIDAADRLAASVESAGRGAGGPIQTGLDRLSDRVTHHADAISGAGREISKPKVTMLGPVPITDHVPLRVQGTRGEDASLSVDVALQGKK